MTTQIVYKYYPFTLYSLAALINKTLWYSSANNFNDPFDSYVVVDYEESLRNVGARKFLEILKSHNEKNPVENSIEFLNSIKNNEHNPGFAENIFNDEYAKALTVKSKEVMRKVRNKIGICCFTDNCSNILMWSHYAESHKGFCVEYELERPHILSKIDYNKESIKIPLMKFFGKNANKEIQQEVFLMKDKNWSYENELRELLPNEANVSKKISGKIKSIIFGCSMSETNRRLIIDTINNCRDNENIIFRVAQLSQEGVKMEFQDLDI